MVNWIRKQGDNLNSFFYRFDRHDFTEDRNKLREALNNVLKEERTILPSLEKRRCADNFSKCTLNWSQSWQSKTYYPKELCWPTCQLVCTANRCDDSFNIERAIIWFIHFVLECFQISGTCMFYFGFVEVTYLTVICWKMCTMVCSLHGGLRQTVLANPCVKVSSAIILPFFQM